MACTTGTTKSNYGSWSGWSQGCWFACLARGKKLWRWCWWYLPVPLTLQGFEKTLLMISLHSFADTKILVSFQAFEDANCWYHSSDFRIQCCGYKYQPNALKSLLHLDYLQSGVNTNINGTLVQGSGWQIQSFSRNATFTFIKIKLRECLHQCRFSRWCQQNLIPRK